MPSRTPTGSYMPPTSFQSLDTPDASPVQEPWQQDFQTLSCCSIFFLLFIELHLFFIVFPSLWHIFSHKSFIHFFPCFILLIFNISESILFLPFFSILISNVAVVFNWFTVFLYLIWTYIVTVPCFSPSSTPLGIEASTSKTLGRGFAASYIHTIPVERNCPLFSTHDLITGKPFQILQIKDTATPSW